MAQAARAIDTLELFDELKSSFTEDQAHVLSRALRQVEETRLSELEARLGELATKQDLLVLKQDLFGLKQGLTNLETKMGALKTEMGALETRMDAKLVAFEGKVIKWMVGLAVAQFSAVIAVLLKLP